MDDLRLTVALLGGDDARLRTELDHACRLQGHRLLDAARLRELRSQPVPDVIVLDSTAGPDSEVDTALTLALIHPHVTIVLVGDGSRRSVAGFRVLDRWRAGESLVDELELAWIGIPASVEALG